MTKKLILFILLLSFITSNAQDTIRAVMAPVQKYSWSILYKINGINQKYITDATIQDGAFAMVIPKGSEAGMYRILYDNDQNKYIDFIYNHEPIELTFHPEHPAELVKYSVSSENKLFQEYLDAIIPIQNKLDTIQTVFFKTKNPKENNQYCKSYKKYSRELNKIQRHFETKATPKLAVHFIKANRRFYPPKLIKDINVYLKTLQSHYFDYIDFIVKVITKVKLSPD